MSKIYEQLQRAQEERLHAHNQVSGNKMSEDRNRNSIVGLSLPGASENLASVSERRGHCRQSVLFSCIELGKNNGGIVLNISQSGLALHAVAELVDDELLKMRFQFSRAHGWVETKGRVVWMSDSNKTAGVEFVDLPDQAREEIQEWISFMGDDQAEGKTRPVDRTKAVGAVAVKGFENQARIPERDEIRRGAQKTVRNSFTKDPGTVPDIAETQLCEAVSGKLRDERNKGTSHANTLRARSVDLGLYQGLLRSGRTRRPMGLLLAAALSVTAIVFLGFHFRTTSKVPLDKKGEVPRSNLAPRGSPNVPLNSVSPTRATELPSHAPELVLQVGAMKNEKNADSLADLLRQKNFPVFVVKPPADSLYRVLVGPYSDVRSAASGEAGLKRLGFEAIRKRNTPAE